MTRIELFKRLTKKHKQKAFKSRMNRIQVKCYLLPEYARPNATFITTVDEIRHFTLVFNESTTGHYDNLIETIKSVYGSSLVNGDELRTYWQDEENELIGFSTDSEFQYAIEEYLITEVAGISKMNNIIARQVW